jgi:hypothetical protein
MTEKLWHMNADFEMELAARAARYRPSVSFEKINRRLAAHLLWLASAGDALLLDEPWPETLASRAQKRGVELVAKNSAGDQRHRILAPWGWTPSAVAVGHHLGAIMTHPPLDVVARVNSKLWSFALEKELGVALPGAAATSNFDELQTALARACPNANDKWVIKSPYGFAARDRVLGRGPKLTGAPATWTRRQLARGLTLIFQPWLEVIREYGVVMMISQSGEIRIDGISDLQTNGAGTGKGYLLGRRPSPQRILELREMGALVGERLFKEGYTGPVGIDALEHTRGLHTLLEINARYTMGHVALEVERALQPSTPFFWSTR